MQDVPIPALRLRDLLRSDILHGTYAEGLLPGERELMLAHRASRSTVRLALAMLREEGTVTRRQGVGTLVTSQVVTRKLVEAHGVERPVASSRTAPFEDLRPVVLEAAVVDCPAAVARLLDARPGAPCALVEYLVLAEEDVVGLCTNYVLFPEGSALLDTPFRTDWYTYLDDAGMTVGDDDFLIGAVAADDGTAHALGIPPRMPLLFMEQVIRDPAGRSFNAAYLYLRADRMMFLSHARARGGVNGAGPGGPTS